MRCSDTKKTYRRESRQIVLITCLAILTLICLLPVLLVVVVSFTDESSIVVNGYSFFPDAWSLEAYKYVGSFMGQLVKSYGVTIFETVTGTFLTLFLSGMLAYAVSRKEFMLRGAINIFLVMTMLINGGIVARYIVNVNIYQMRNNLLVLILPSCITVYNVTVMRSYITSNVPESIIEAAKIDGAGETYTYFRIVLPLLLPVLAALGFMTAVGHWNQWMTSFMYIDNPNLTTLQHMLMKIEKNLEFLKQNIGSLSAEEIQQLKNAPDDSCRMAMLFCTLVPIMIAYPFFQKYFISGLTVGAVKG